MVSIDQWISTDRNVFKSNYLGIQYAQPCFFHSDVVTLHPAEEDDIDFIQQCMNDSRVCRPALDINPMNCEQGAEFFENVISSSDTVHCLACDGDEPMGVVSLSESQYEPDETARSRAAELAYWFTPEYHGQGYGSDAATRMVQYVFEDRNLRRVSAQVGSFNKDSISLLESLWIRTRRYSAGSCVVPW